MTVSPRYADYPGVFDTGLLAPVEVAAELLPPPPPPPLPDPMHALLNDPALPPELQPPQQQEPQQPEEVVTEPMEPGGRQAAAEAGGGTGPSARGGPPWLRLPAERGGGGTGGGNSSSRRLRDPGRPPDEAADGGSRSRGALGRRGAGGEGAASGGQAAGPQGSGRPGGVGARPGGQGAGDIVARAQQAVTTVAAAAKAAARAAEAAQPTRVTYARLYACQERGVLRVFVDHPVFRAGGGGQGPPPGSGGGGGGRGRDAVMSALGALPPPGADPSVGVYTYSEGRLGGADLQARNSVLCQAALAAPVLLWLDGPEGMPQQLRVSAAGVGTVALWDWGRGWGCGQGLCRHEVPLPGGGLCPGALDLAGPGA